MMSPVLAATELTLAGDLLVDADLSVQPGELVVLDAPSGAGSSYLLTVLAGFTRPVRGKVLIGGRPLCAPDTRVALLQQEHDLAPELTAAETVSLPLRASPRRSDGAGRELFEATRRWLGAFGLAAAANQRVTQLSGGQRQRAALARCFASGAPVLLLDDPTAELDAANRAVVTNLVVEHVAAGGSAVAASHDHDLIERSHRQVTIVDRQIVSGPVPHQSG